ncbi:hypothetical protein DRQ07_02480 [candidate division KSB1 bacterium]|nr:MAG: hypothetical protein DRQ07_02480 [candidate division KSB1 bacterium]
MLCAKGWYENFTDYALGEMAACRFYGWLEYNDDESKPVSCPIGRCGEDAVWRIVSEQVESPTNSPASPVQHGHAAIATLPERYKSEELTPSDDTRLLDRFVEWC